MDFWTFIVIVIIGIVGYKFWKNKQEERESEVEESGDASSPQEAQGRLRKTKLNAKWRIVNSWSELIAGAEGKEETAANIIKQTLKEVAAPNLNVEHRKVSLAGLTALFAGSRKQLVIENRKLRGYHVFVSIEDYGKQLNVSWYLMLRKNWLTNMLQASAANVVAAFFLFPFVVLAKLLYSKRGYTIPELMNMFDFEELTAYGTTVHRAVIKAVEEIMGQLNMDFSKVDTKSRGFLNIS